MARTPPEDVPSTKHPTRRQVVSAGLIGASGTYLACASDTARKTATDQITLGATGINTTPKRRPTSPSQQRREDGTEMNVPENCGTCGPAGRPERSVQVQGCVFPRRHCSCRRNPTTSRAVSS
jgi:hypothetical protein